MRILLACAHTGGHIYPALAVAGELRERMPDTSVLFVGGTREIQNKILSDAGYEMKKIPVVGLPRKLSPALVTFVGKLGISIVRSMQIIRGFKPSLVMSTGGYVAGPPIIAACVLGVPVVMQEQNSYPGITTKYLARFAEVVFLGFEDAARYLKAHPGTVVTGNPVRKEIGTGNRTDAAAKFGLDPGLKTVLVFGGSQGSRAINTAFSGIVEKLGEHDLQVIWQTGAAEFERWRSYDGAAQGKIKVVPYLDAMSDAYTAADLVVARAGAMSIAEITVCGLPAIFIPLPTAAERHQEHNARSLVEAKAASMILEENLSPDVLEREIMGILTSDKRCADMSAASRQLGKRDAAGRIAEFIIERFGMN